MAFDIRPARLEDADALAEFLKELHHFARLEPLSLDAVRAQVRRHLDLCLSSGSHSVYLAESGDGRIVGYTSVHWLPYLFLPGPEGYVSELFVAGTARGQRVGTRLLEVVKEEARRRGCSRLSLLNMRDRESYARGFYAQDGWQERSDAANFVFDFRAPAAG